MKSFLIRLLDMIGIYLQWFLCILFIVFGMSRCVRTLKPLQRSSGNEESKTWFSEIMIHQQGKLLPVWQELDVAPVFVGIVLYHLKL